MGEAVERIERPWLGDMPGRVEVMGCPVDPWDMAQTVEATRRAVGAGAFAHLIGVNADKLLQMRDDSWMDACVRRCEIVNADGASMVMASRRLGAPVPERVTGIDLMDALCALAAEQGWGVYLLGAAPGVALAAADELAERHAGLVVSGARDGYFPDEGWGAVAEEVRSSGARIAFVGITSPKKERLIEHFRELGLSGAFVGVGGSFDVLSGNIPRAPEWMQRSGLEWAFRMAQEPGRLVKRYAVGNTRFLALLLRESLRKGRA